MRYSRRPVIVLSLITALCIIGDSILYIALPIYYNEAGLSTLWHVGLILSINRLIRIPLNPIIGWMYRRISIRTGMLLSVVLASLTTIGYAIAGALLCVALSVLWYKNRKMFKKYQDLHDQK